MSRTTSIILLMGWLAGCRGIEGNGQLVRESRELADFTAIRSDSPLNVEVRQGDQTTVVVALDSNLLPRVHTEVLDQTLTIQTDGDLLDFVRAQHVLVTMPHLTSAWTSGTGSFDASTFDETETIRLVVSGSGPFAFAGSAPRIEAVVEDSGKMLLSGTAGDVHLAVSGSGDLDARDVEADNAYVAISSSGGVSATVNGLVDIDMRGSGNVDLYGAVVRGSTYMLGTGEIRVH